MITLVTLYQPLLCMDALMENHAIVALAFMAASFLVFAPLDAHKVIIYLDSVLAKEFELFSVNFAANHLLEIH